MGRRRQECERENELKSGTVVGAVRAAAASPAQCNGEKSFNWKHLNAFSSPFLPLFILACWDIAANGRLGNATESMSSIQRMDALQQQTVTLFFRITFSLPSLRFFFYLALARLSPRFQWFISIYSLFFLASPLFVRLSKKWYFRKHLAQYCFSRALCTILQQEAASATSGWRGGRLRPEWACVSNTKWWEKSILSIFCLFHTLFWTHNCTFLRCRGRHTQLHDRRKKKPRVWNKTCLCLFGAGCECARLRCASETSFFLAASYDSITFRTRFATFDFILKSFFFSLPHILSTTLTISLLDVTRCLREVCSSLLHSILSVIAKFNIKNIFIFVLPSLEWWKWNCDVHLHWRSLSSHICMYRNGRRKKKNDKNKLVRNNSIKIKNGKNARNEDIDK